MRRAVLAALIFVHLAVGFAEAGTVTLIWDPNPETNLAGYHVSYGTAAGQYTSTVDVGNVTSYQFTEPNPAVRYYIAVRAYNSAGAISGYSNEVVTTPAMPQLTVTGLTANKASPQTTGTSITFSATAAGGVAPLQFKWWIDNGAGSTVGQQWSAGSTFTWTPTSAGSNYKIRVWARNASSTADAPDNPTATLEMTFAINASGGGGGTGTGLTGEYFNNPGPGTFFTTLATTRTDATVNFDWTWNAPAAGVQSDYFSVRWTGQVLAPTSGTYRFATTSDDGVRLWVNGQQVINDWTNHAPMTNTSPPITLTAGVRYDIRVEYYEGASGAMMQLLWTPPGQAQTIIPQAQLFVAGAGTPNQAPTVNAGADRTITLPSGTTLGATVSDDGQPNPPAIVTLSWTKVTGPGTVSFSAPGAATTTASFSAAGSYVLRLTASDSVLSTSDDVTVTVNPASSPNVAPTVNAGADRTITLPSGTTLGATVSDDGQPNPPATVTLSWARVSGPGTVSFSAPGAATTTASFSAAGSYVLRLTASDSVLSTSDDVTVTVNPAAGGGGGTGTGLTGEYFNNPGPGTFFTTLATTRTDATVNFDWTWNAPAAGVQGDYFSVRWTGQVLAPTSGTYRFATTSDDGVRLWVNGQQVINDWTNHAPTTNTSAAITLTAAVRYDIRVEYYEGTSGAMMQLLWTPPGQAQAVIPQAQLFVAGAGTPNQAPTVNAGADRTITLPSSTTLGATVSDDGQPNPPATVTLSWTRVSGPGTVTFSAPGAATTTASFSAAGSYVLRLTASDGVLSTSDDVTVTVNPAAGGGGGTGTGLTGEYFNNPGPGTFFTTLATTRTDATVNFDWTWNAPAAGVQGDYFSVRWTGQVLAPTSGTYRFATTSDDGVRLWVNGQQVINDWTNHAPTTNTSAAITLTAGVRYDIRVEYYEGTSGAMMQLLWMPPGQTQTVIPQAQLFP